MPFAKTSSTFEDRFLASGKRPSGFDYMRLILAISIIFFHTVSVNYGVAATARFLQSAPASIWGHSMVPMFFALSGFLVAGSAERARTVFSFLGLRILRIVPALGAEIFLSALVLGIVFTALPLRQYLMSNGFHAYFLNIIGDIHFYLPGVFTDNPVQKVNAQLWTIPAELACYATLAGMILGGFLRRPRLLLLAFALAQIELPFAALFIPALGPELMGMPDWLLVLSFLSGILMFLYRDRIPWRLDFALASFALYAGLVLFAPLGLWFVSVPVGYLTVYLGLLNPRRLRLIESGDYSYGLYLYGYPIQQAVVASGLVAHVWWINIVVTLPLAFCFAAASWHLLEKRALSLRKPLMALEDRLLAAAARRRGEVQPAVN